MTHEFLAVYPAKLLEYGTAVAYLAGFVLFWRYVQGGAGAPEVVRRLDWKPAIASWFTLPEGLLLHPGHAWARLAGDGTVTVGLDDFAHKLVGAARVELPAPGTRVAQGDAAVALGDGGRSVDLLSPVDGEVVEVNRAVLEDPARLADPYGEGWLYRVRPARFGANAKQLFGGGAARRLLAQAGEALSARIEPELGQALADGGAPIAGMARELDPERWDEVAREFLRS
ncbi:glycine cleavage system protein H [Anaeromyxobacter paludicola]|uniref:Glycine cleavage H-protein n=1 Tax=Anaeromyxobacter paludicola TaxID=2918171 RepID=A0ABN6NC85_9BACT|nr:glycine cleavage system protein H [Anaeromyxobacter paludicola]BDG09562.1 hypothetical protein AMPC_26750 [Anaeromyxobacter paludicola]